MTPGSPAHRATQLFAGLLLSFAGLWAGGAAAADVDYLPLSAIKPGQTGEVVTVFAGTKRQVVPVEILGVAEGFAGPGRDVILARLSGPEADRSGVVAGMSGSPVFIEGRLAGALAYGIGSFPLEPIAGITPIEHMLAIPTQTAGQRQARSLSYERYPLAPLFPGTDWPETTVLQGDSAQALTPVAFGGVVEEIRRHFAPVLAGLGLGPWQSTLEAGAAAPAAELKGGDPVAAVLVSGDLTVAGTGTTTLVDGDMVYAFGHPLMRAGEVDFPMARASILVTVPSQLQSFKLSRLGPVIGAFHHDRTTGVAGRLGAVADVVPVRLLVTSADGLPEKTYNYRIARLSALSPALLDMAVSNSLMSHERGGMGGMVLLSGVISMAGLPPVSVNTAFAAGPSGGPMALQASRHLAGVYAALARSPYTQGRSVSVDLQAHLDTEPRMQTIRHAHLQKDTARSGDTVNIHARLVDENTGEHSKVTFQWAVPELPSGTTVNLMVGDAAALMQVRGTSGLLAVRQAGSGESLARALNTIPARRSVYLWVGREAPGWRLGAQNLPGLPVSVATVMKRQGSGSPLVTLPGAALDEQQIDLPAVINGSVWLKLEVQ